MATCRIKNLCSRIPQHIDVKNSLASILVDMLPTRRAWKRLAARAFQAAVGMDNANVERRKITVRI
jgi:hypothetical protein